VAEAVNLPRLIQFGIFEVELQSGELRKAGQKLKFSGQPFQVLAILLERPGEVVTREELQKRLWPDTFVDVDHNLNTAINKIREVLGDEAENPRFVETLPRKGYRFIGAVNGARQTTREEKPTVWSRRVAIRFLVLAAIVIIAIPVVLVSLNVRGWRDRIFVRTPRIQALAVLPFENLSNAPGQEYFSDGMTQALITELGKIGGPRVISRHSIMQFKGSKKTLQQISLELSVDAIVEGTVERSGNRVLVTMHLAQVSPERQLWANEYDRGIRDVPGLQGEIARAVAGEIKVKLTPEQEGALAIRVPVDPEAHLEYLQGLYYGSKDTEVDLRTAVTHFEKAVAKDPNYAAAYAELALSYFWLGQSQYGGPSVKETGPPANAAVAKALQLDASLAHAHLAQGLLATNDWNWPEAERQYRLAISLDSNCAECHHQYGVLLQGLGLNEDAVTQIKYAVELDPLDDGNRNQLALIALTSRQYDLAIARFEALRNSAWRSPLALSYAKKERYPEAIAILKKCETNFCLGFLAQVYGLAGKKRQAQEILDGLKRTSHHHYVFPTVFAQAYLGLDDKEQALTWLERAYAEKDPYLFWLKVGPSYDPLRSEPRFQALMRKLNFSQ
jgi:TolB-like protein/DNA-binding winged helix-turn-helix (wHTH) protein/tetratricopeptide (TPR) repeat protein